MCQFGSADVVGGCRRSVMGHVRTADAGIWREMMLRSILCRRFVLFLTICVACVGSAVAQTTSFTYQGKLNDGANPASGNYDMQFKLFDTTTIGTGAQQGPTITIAS